MRAQRRSKNLTPAERAAILAEYELYRHNMPKVIAARYGVSRETVTTIVWKARRAQA